MSSYDSSGQKTAATIEAQPHECPHCDATYDGDRTPRGRPYCDECRRIIDGERPEGERYSALSYSALGAGQ